MMMTMMMMMMMRESICQVQSQVKYD